MTTKWNYVYISLGGFAPLKVLVTYYDGNGNASEERTFDSATELQIWINELRHDETVDVSPVLGQLGVS